jgi:hypothetical protein
MVKAYITSHRNQARCAKTQGIKFSIIRTFDRGQVRTTRMMMMTTTTTTTTTKLMVLLL